MPSADDRAGSLSGMIRDKTTTCKRKRMLCGRNLRYTFVINLTPNLVVTGLIFCSSTPCSLTNQWFDNR